MELREDWKENLQMVINHCKATPDDSWCEDVVRTKDGKNCLMGHVFAMGRNDKEGNDWWNWFENAVATTFMVYPVNDGTNPKYPQKSAKERCIAYMEDLLAGREKTTADYFRELDARQLGVGGE